MIRRIHVPTFLRRFRTRNWVGRKVIVTRPGEGVNRQIWWCRIKTVAYLQWTPMGLAIWVDGGSWFWAKELDWWGE